MLLFADANVTNKLLLSAAIKEWDNDTLTVNIKGVWHCSERCCAHDRINSSGQCVSLEGRLKVAEGLREQTVPRNPTFPFSCRQELTVTVKNRRESSGTSGRPESRGDGGRGRGRSPWDRRACSEGSGGKCRQDKGLSVRSNIHAGSLSSTGASDHVVSGYLLFRPRNISQLLWFDLLKLISWGCFWIQAISHCLNSLNQEIQ